jgi:hypothetical protein
LPILHVFFLKYRISDGSPTFARKLLKPILPMNGKPRSIFKKGPALESLREISCFITNQLGQLGYVVDIQLEELITT